MPDAIIDNRPLNVTIRHYRGSTFSESFGFNVDLTGGSAKFTIRRTKTSPTPIVQKTIAAAEMTIDTEAPHTKIPVLIPSSEQAAWEEETYFYDLELTFADSTNDTFIGGELEIYQDIS